jgi:N-acetylneuraminate lyase
MTDSERKDFAKQVVRTAAGRVPVIVHIGAIGTKRSIELAAHAQDIGADAVSSVPPFYYQFTPDEIYGYYQDICSSVDIPMIVYNISLAGLMNNDLVERLAGIEHVAGLKFTGTQLYDMGVLKQKLGRDFMVYSGCDEMAAQGLSAGADGIIGSFYNLIPDTFIEIFERAQKGDYVAAFEMQKIATDFILTAVKYGHIGVMKQCLMDIGVDAGYARKPFVHPDRSKMAEIWSYCDRLREEMDDTHMRFMYRKLEEA